jgi:hypothetical protein
MRPNLDTNGLKNCLRNGPSRYAGSRLPGTCALKNISNISETVFPRTRKIRVTRPRKVNFVDLCLNGPWVHSIEPVLKVCVDDVETDGTPKSLAVSNTSGDISLVGLNLHTATTPVTKLAPR